MSPLVSVLMPAYNRASLIRLSIESVLAQGMRDFELVVVDDGSGDGTAEVAEGYRDERIRVIRNFENRGIVASRNVALAAARGEYLAWLDSDDLATPDRLGKQVAWLEASERRALCCGRWVVIDEGGREIGEGERERADLPLGWSLLWGNPIAQSSVMLRRSALEASGIRYDPACRLSEDYDFWCRLAFAGEMGKLDDVILKYRRQEDSAFHSSVAETMAISFAINERFARAVAGGYERAHASLTRFAWALEETVAFGDAAGLVDWCERLESGYLRRFGASERERIAIRAHVEALISRHVRGCRALFEGDENRRSLRARSSRLYRDLAAWRVVEDVKTVAKAILAAPARLSRGRTGRQP